MRTVYRSNTFVVDLVGMLLGKRMRRLHQVNSLGRGEETLSRNFEPGQIHKVIAPPEGATRRRVSKTHGRLIRAYANYHAPISHVEEPRESVGSLVQHRTC